MKKIIRSLLLVLAMSGIMLQRSNQVKADIQGDGTYSMEYTVYQNGTDSASIANDYFDKPATVIVNNGTYTVQLQMNHSAWITGFNAGTANTAVSANPAADTRIVQFQTTSLANKVNAQIKVDIDNESLNYHHQYTIQIGFNQQSAKLIAAAKSEPVAAASSKSAATTDNTGVNSTITPTKPEANPQTGHSSHTVFYSSLALLAAVFLIIQLGKKKEENRFDEKA